jgi:hypothetical protein
MKKIIRKFWGVGLVLILLSTLLVGALPQAAAASYAWSADTSQPTVLNGVLATPGFSVLDVAQSGSTIYAVANCTANINFLYKSVNGGASWFPCVAALIPNTFTDNWTMVATAPDDPNWVVVVNNPLVGNDAVYASRDGGATFEAMPAGVSVVINDATMSHDIGVRYIVVAGNDGAGAGTVDSWMVGPIAPVWTDISGAIGWSTNIAAAEFTSNFPADSGLIVVNEDSGNTTTVSTWVYSYNLLQWNPAGYGFPRVIALDSGAGAITCPRAYIALDENFYLGDVTSQIGFVGASIIDTVLAEVGGVFRFDLDITLEQTQIYAGGGVNSVAWDGTNLMAGLFAGAATVVRSSNPLAAAGWAFFPNSPFKAPGTGTLPLVIFNGGVGYCFSRGTNSAVARTTDYGATFDGIALVNSNFATVTDFWVSPDASVTYAVTDDGVDVNLWKKSGTTWTRVMILAGLTTQVWFVRADADDPDTVYIGQQGGVVVYKSLDGTVTWITRAFASPMQDFVVQDANTLYEAVQGAATVRKTDSGAFLWYTPVATGLATFGNTIYSLTLVADDQLVVGSNAGMVAYSADGNTSWVPIIATNALAAGNTITEATGLATGDTIWAATAGGDVGRWLIGTSTAWDIDVTSVLALPAASYTGLAYEDGVLYAWDDASNNLSRYLYPTMLVTLPSDKEADATAPTYATSLNALKASMGSNTLWAYDSSGAVEVLDWYSDYIIGAAMAPAPTYPTNDIIIDVNSIAGNVNAFNFQWTAPMGSLPAGALYFFDIAIFLDEGMTIAAGGAAGIGAALFDGGVGSILSTAGALGFAPVPGETYYWRVRVAAGSPLQSFWSPLQSFSIQQLVAVVPVISSPANGSEVNNTSPGFSWSPIAGATGYRFELATDADFTDVIYTVDPTTAGANLPSTITLERGMQYFWHVKTLTPAEGEWSTTANFIVAELPVETTPVTITTAEQPTIIISQPADTTTQIVVTQEPEKVVNPSYIWAIIVVGAVLVIAVIILIVRTRRTV